MAVLGLNTGETLLQGIGSFWDRSFKDHEMLQGAYRAVNSELSQTYLDVISTALKLSISDIPVYDKELWKFIDLKVADFAEVDGQMVGPLPDNYKGSMFLQNKVIGATVVYEEGYQFEVDLDAGTLVFYTNVLDPVANGLPSYIDSDDNVHVGLWAQDAYVDNESLYKYFGYQLNKTGESSEKYKDFLRGMWSYFMLGPNVEYIESALCVMAGIAVCATDGEIISDIDESDPLGVKIETDRNIYYLPFGSVLDDDIIVGAELSVFQNFTSTFTVVDYIEDPQWWYNFIVPYRLVKGLSLHRRRSRDAWYAPIYEDIHESITAFADEAGTDFSALVSPGDYLYVGDPGEEEGFQITEIVQPNPDSVARILRFEPPMPLDIPSGARYALGDLADMEAFKAFASDGYNLRVGGTYYGQLETFYGEQRHRNMAWNLWYFFLQYHTFLITYDTDSVPDDINLEELISIIVGSRPSYTLPIFAPWNDLSETLNVADDLTITIGQNLDDTVAFDDNTLVYGPSVSYFDPCTYFGMMDRNFTMVEEAAYSFTVYAKYTTYYSVTSAPISYALADGTIASAGAMFDDWVLKNSGKLTSLDDVVLSDSIEMVHNASTSAFFNATKTSPRIQHLVDNPFEWYIKLDVSALASNADSRVHAYVHSVTDPKDWLSINVYYNAGSYYINSFDTVDDVTSSGVAAQLNGGAGITYIWMKIERTLDSFDDFVLSYKLNDGDAWTTFTTLTRTDIDKDPYVGWAVDNKLGNAFTIASPAAYLAIRVS